MKPEAKTQLESLLGAYDEKLAEVERREAAIRAAQAAFPERFATLRAMTIRPALQELADVLNGHGHESATREQEESSTTAGGITSATISLRIIPKPFTHKSTEVSNNFIEVTFSANRTERKITVSSTNTIANSGGSRGRRGEYDIEALTADIVASHVLQTLQEAFAEAR
jgi:hypothetical protein